MSSQGLQPVSHLMLSLLHTHSTLTHSHASTMLRPQTSFSLTHACVPSTPHRHPGSGQAAEGWSAAWVHSLALLVCVTWSTAQGEEQGPLAQVCVCVQGVNHVD